MKRTLVPGYTIGADAYGDVAPVCLNFGAKAVVIGGKRALAAAMDRLRSAIESSPLRILDEIWYGGEASYENAERLMDHPAVRDADMIFAVGGGKVCDCCKVIAHRTNRPLFTFPTIASNCAPYTSLAIIYHPDHTLNEYSRSDVPPKHTFIDTDIIAHAPSQYLWAGIGDTIAKHYESTASCRGLDLRHSEMLGIKISAMCAQPMLRWGVQALADAEAHTESEALREVTLNIIVSTGLVSNFVDTDLNAGVAHAVYNGFTVLPETAEHGHLHGEIVAYGLLVSLIMDKDYGNLEAIYAFNKSMKLPTKLADLDTSEDRLLPMADKALESEDLTVYPYKVTKEMILNSVHELELYNQAH